jgi:protein HIRA/HIR1
MLNEKSSIFRDSHLSCVNAVRWSSNGQMLASGADDKLLMIWKKVPGPSGSFGSSGMTKNVENWRCSATLRGHGGDVLDVAWSPQDRWLASSSVDNTIIVWDAQSFPTIVAMLKGHQGLVKGVTWDPVGKFLASQSDDRSVKIWKTSDWTIQNTITEPFEECGGTTHILRLSWSPDGQYLVSAHAMNGGGPTAQIIERDGWKCDKDFVGHRKAVTCVRFHNSILKRQAPKTNKPQQYCCLAIGSRDRCLSVWMTALQRPLLVIRDLFTESILDLSWSHDGYVLLACSGDGTVACLQFNEDQLGKPLSEDDKNSLYQRMYGKDATIDISAQAEKEMIIENSDLLNVMEKPRGPPSLLPMAAAAESPPVVFKPPQVTTTKTVVASPNKPILKQVETKTADGKRRITPMFIPLTEDTPAAPMELSSSSSSRSQIVFEKPEASQPQQEQPPTPVQDQQKLDTRLAFRDTPQKPKTSFGDVTMPAASPAMLTTKNSIPVVRMTAGKAQALVGGQCVKIASDFRVQVMNDASKTQFGSISRVVCINMRHQQATDKKAWELVVGSTVTAFSICSKYVLIGAMDGSVRLIHIRTGMLVVPVLNQASPIMLSAFVSSFRVLS